MWRSSLLALLLFSVAAQPALAAISVVQTATSNTGTAGTSPSVTFGSAPANNDVLLFSVQWASSSVTATLPNGYNSIQKNQSIANCYAQFTFWEFASSATTTITFTNLLSANAVYSITGFDISGTATSSPINISGSNGSSACGATHAVQPTVTSGVSNALAITTGVDDGSGTNLSAPSGYTAVQALTTFNTNGKVGVYYKTGIGTGTVNPNWGSGTNAHAQVLVVAPYVAPPPGSGSMMMMGCCK